MGRKWNNLTTKWLGISSSYTGGGQVNQHTLRASWNKSFVSGLLGFRLGMSSSRYLVISFRLFTWFRPGTSSSRDDKYPQDETRRKMPCKQSSRDECSISHFVMMNSISPVDDSQHSSWVLRVFRSSVELYFYIMSNSMINYIGKKIVFCRLRSAGM